ncbi:hypothetical protein [Candidatus Palauibacter sp.]|uniref:hypothetical protein n=1 Tax=Candidatus Palauibacter sp. TaxID=3101350 RepID=UPI003B012B55
MPEGGGTASSFYTGLELILQIGETDEGEGAHASQRAQGTPLAIRHQDDGNPRNSPLDLPQANEHFSREMSPPGDDEAVNIRIIRNDLVRDIQHSTGAADCIIYSLRIPGHNRKDPDHCSVYFPGGAEKPLWNDPPIDGSNQ